MATPYYEKNGIVIYHGDARDFLDLVPTGSVLLTDPVYGIDGGRGGDARDFGKGKYEGKGWEDTAEYVASVCVPVVEKILSVAVRGAVTPGNRCLFLYPKPTDVGCFWCPAAVTHGPWGFLNFNPILYYGKDPRAGKGALPTGIAVTEMAEKNGHPCPKPIRSWQWLLNKVAMPGEIVVDPFMGSGTTLRAAKDLGYKAIGIEIEEKYCETAVNRLAQEVLF